MKKQPVTKRFVDKKERRRPIMKNSAAIRGLVSLGLSLMLVVIRFMG
ncbi:MAG: hypothetical protein FWD25_07530 [Clostridia bacterium]|nr:hypothetical protein [Clostridia bacterium]